MTDLLDALPPPGERPDRARLLGAELFSADHRRPIITELAAVRRSGTEVDVGRVVDLMTTRQAIPEIPFAATRTTRTGLHLLLDTSPSMRPFLRDLRLLAARARTVVGQEEVIAMRFSGSPHKVWSLTNGGAERPYRPPLSPCAVLVATDLGIAAPAAGAVPASWSEWSAFAQTVHAAGCPLILLVPYPADRRPAWTARGFAVVIWDRTTDVGQARRAADRAADLLRSPR